MGNVMSLSWWWYMEKVKEKKLLLWIKPSHKYIVLIPNWSSVKAKDIPVYTLGRINIRMQHVKERNLCHNPRQKLELSSCAAPAHTFIVDHNRWQTLLQNSLYFALLYTSNIMSPVIYGQSKR